MNQDDIKQQLQKTQKPTDTNKQKDRDSARLIVENALAEAEKGDLSGIGDMFIASVKKIRELSEADFLPIKARYGAIKGLLASDLNRQTKVYRKKPDAGEDGNNSGGRTSKADMLIELVKSKGELFHDPDDETFVTFQVPHIDTETGEETGQHHETWNVRSKGFKKWSSHLFYITHQTVPGDTATNEAIDTLAGIGQFDGVEIETSLRYAMYEDTVYVDIGNENWQVVAINKEGYKVVDSHKLPVRFLRSSIYRPLPIPKKDGDISLLWDHLNIESEDGRILTLAWLLEVMRITRPYPVLEISGQQGSAKSTFQKRLREMIDPNKVDLRSAPRNVEDIFVATRNSHVISYNNLSHLTANTQDAFCTLSTGGGDATRKLYSTSEEEAWEAMRPIMMNGISQLATRPDLADRTVAIELPQIKGYVTEAELKKKWEKDKPLIMGALYELLSKTLVELPDVRLDSPPRMADFARLGQAMLNAQDVDDSFTEIFKRNRDRVVMRAIDGSPIAQALIKLLDSEVYFKGTKGGLMDRLEKYKPKHFDRSAYPKTVRGFSDALRRLAPALLVQDIEIIEDKTRHTDGYRVEVRKLDRESSERESEEVEL